MKKKNVQRVVIMCCLLSLMLPVNCVAFYRGEMPGVQGIPHWRGGRFQRPVQARRFFPAVLDYQPLVQSQVQGWL